jgi:hypothetical protein
MNSTERKLLENVLDFLDRLFDRKLTAHEVWTLLFATQEAVRGTDHFAPLEQASQELIKIVRKGGSEMDQQDLALRSTDSLRHYLANVTRE